MKKFGLLVAFAALGMASAANAADLARRAPAEASYQPASWAGLYGDIYGLYGANLTNSSGTVGGTPLDFAASPNGPGIGGAIGYNFEATNGIVWGPRLDLAYANFHGSGSVAQVLSFSNATNYLGDLDLVLGKKLSADGRLLGYFVGGFAFGGAKPNLTVVGLAPTQVQAAANDTSTGWNVGAGLRYQFTPQLSGFMEGDYYRLGDKSLTATFGGLPIATATAPYHIFEQRFGLSLKLPPL